MRSTIVLVAIGITGCASIGEFPSVPAERPSACEVEYRVTPNYDTTPRTLEVVMAFPANGRTETPFSVQSSWSGVDDFASALKGWRATSPATHVETTADAHRFRAVHPPTGQVEIAFQALPSLRDPDGGEAQEPDSWYRTQIGRDWFQFFGYSVLPALDVGPFMQERELCVGFVDTGGVLVASPLSAPGSSTVRLHGSRRTLWHAFYAGGSGWRVLDGPVPNEAPRFALRGRFDFDDATFVEKAGRLLLAHRRFWADSHGTPAWWVITPNHHAGLNAGTVVGGATVLSLGQRFTPAGNGFQFLVGHEALHQWIPHRFGSVSTNGDGSTYWFSEGFTEYYAHRLLLESGVWTAEEYATALTRVLQSYWRSPSRNQGLSSLAPRFDTDRDASNQFYARGELLAMRWAHALSKAGGPSLDELLRGLLLPPTTEPQNQPSAVDRVLAALEPWLGRTPRADVRSFMVEGRDLPLADDLLPSGFTLRWVEQPRRLDGRELEGSLERLPVVVTVPR